MALLHSQHSLVSSHTRSLFSAAACNARLLLSFSSAVRPPWLRRLRHLLRSPLSIMRVNAGKKTGNSAACSERIGTPPRQRRVRSLGQPTTTAARSSESPPLKMARRTTRSGARSAFMADVTRSVIVCVDKTCH